MKIAIESVAAYINVDRILTSRGLGSSTTAVRKLGNEIARHADKRVPMRRGMLKNSKQIVASGAGNGYIVYPGPYAHYQNEGKAMGGRAPKHYTGAKLTYHGSPMRGAEWIDRTMREDGDKIIAGFAKAIGGTVK